MARIGPGTGLSGPNAGKEEKATASESDDAAEDPPDNSGSNDSEPTRTTAATGTLAALSHEEAGAEDVQNKNVGVAGSSVDALQDPETGDVAYASDSQSWQGDGQMATVNMATPEGGVDVNVSPDGEVDPGRPGGSRLSEVRENYRDASTSDDSQPDPTQQNNQTRDQTNDSGPTTNTETEQQAQQRFSSSGQGFGSGGLGFPGSNGSGSGDLMNKLTSPAGMVAVVIATAVLVFGGSEAIEEEDNS